MDFFLQTCRNALVRRLTPDKRQHIMEAYKTFATAGLVFAISLGLRLFTDFGNLNVISKFFSGSLPPLIFGRYFSHRPYLNLVYLVALGIVCGQNISWTVCDNMKSHPMIALEALVITCLTFMCLVMHALLEPPSLFLLWNLSKAMILAISAYAIIWYFESNFLNILEEKLSLVMMAIFIYFDHQMVIIEYQIGYRYPSRDGLVFFIDAFCFLKCVLSTLLK